MGETAYREVGIGASVPTPRGPNPSIEDRPFTERLAGAGKLLAISLHDRVMIGDGTTAYYSFADAGGLDDVRGHIL